MVAINYTLWLSMLVRLANLGLRRIDVPHALYTKLTALQILGTGRLWGMFHLILLVLSYLFHLYCILYHLLIWNQIAELIIAFCYLIYLVGCCIFGLLCLIYFLVLILLHNFGLIAVFEPIVEIIAKFLQKVHVIACSWVWAKFLIPPFICWFRVMRIVNSRNRPCSQKKTYILHLLHLQLITWSQLTTNVRPTLGHTEPRRLNFRLDERPHVIHYILTVPVFKVIQDLLKPIYVSWTDIFILFVLWVLFPSLKVICTEERIA